MNDLSRRHRRVGRLAARRTINILRCIRVRTVCIAAGGLYTRLREIIETRSGRRPPALRKRFAIYCANERCSIRRPDAIVCRRSMGAVKPDVLCSKSLCVVIAAGGARRC